MLASCYLTFFKSIRNGKNKEWWYFVLYIFWQIWQVFSWALSTRVKQSRVFYSNAAYWSPFTKLTPDKTDHNPYKKRALFVTTLGFIKSKIEPLNSHHFWNSSLWCLRSFKSYFQLTVLFLWGEQKEGTSPG